MKQPYTAPAMICFAFVEADILTLSTTDAHSGDAVSWNEIVQKL